MFRDEIGLKVDLDLEMLINFMDEQSKKWERPYDQDANMINGIGIQKQYEEAQEYPVAVFYMVTYMGDDGVRYNNVYRLYFGKDKKVFTKDVDIDK